MSLSKIEFEREVNTLLRKFAEQDLKVSDEYRHVGIQLCENVRKSLEQAMKGQRFSIASTHYYGSIPKGTDVINPDFDMLMKINNDEPPFKDVREFFEQTLKKNASQLQINVSSITLTNSGVTFSFVNKMEVDLHPATTLTESEAIKKMRGSHKLRCYYGGSLVLAQVDFVKSQSDFARAVARVAKYWYKSMNNLGGHFVPGGSTVFECLAVASVLELEEMRELGEPMLSALTRVADKLENLHQLRLAFEKTAGSWRIQRDAVQGQSIPYLMAPANPVHNHLTAILKDVALVETFKGNAIELKTRFKNLIEKQEYCEITKDGGTQVKIDFVKLFEF